MAGLLLLTFTTLLFAAFLRSRPKIIRFYHRRYPLNNLQNTARTVFHPLGGAIIVVLAFALLWPILAALSIFVFPVIAIVLLGYYVQWHRKQSNE